MPELPEVENVRRGLEKTTLNQKIKKLNLIYPKLVDTDVKEFVKTAEGQKIIGFRRRGKFLLIDLENGHTIVSHLRMEGKYSVEAAGVQPRKHTELVFQLSNKEQIFYDDTRKFGRMQLTKTGAEGEIVKSIASMGPEPTKKTLTVDYLEEALSKSKKEIKPWLLDQNNVAGVGNIYADEVLWMSKIHPQTPANHLDNDDIQQLRDNIIDELKFATQKGGSTVHTFTALNNKKGSMQDHLHAYGKVGQPCERCGTEMVKIKVAQRGTTYCPYCQKIK